MSSSYSYVKEWRKRNPDKVRAQNKRGYKRTQTWKERNRILNRVLTTQMKLFTGCELCGYSQSACALDFHHIERGGKVNRISQMLSGPFPPIFEESLKCKILCANCHRMVTHGELKV